MIHAIFAVLDWVSYWLGAIFVYPIAFFAVVIVVYAFVAFVHDLLTGSLRRSGAPVNPGTPSEATPIMPRPQRQRDFWAAVDEHLIAAGEPPLPSPTHIHQPPRPIVLRQTPHQRVMSKLDDMIHARPLYKRVHRRRPINED